MSSAKDTGSLDASQEVKPLPCTYKSIEKEYTGNNSLFRNFQYLPKADILHFEAPSQWDRCYRNGPSKKLQVGSIVRDGSTSKERAWVLVYNSDVHGTVVTVVNYFFDDGTRFRLSDFARIEFIEPFNDITRVTNIRYKDKIRYLVLFYFMEEGLLDEILVIRKDVKIFMKVCEEIAERARATGRQPVREKYGGEKVGFAGLNEVVHADTAANGFAEPPPAYTPKDSNPVITAATSLTTPGIHTENHVVQSRTEPAILHAPTPGTMTAHSVAADAASSPQPSRRGSSGAELPTTQKTVLQVTYTVPTKSSSDGEERIAEEAAIATASDEPTESYHAQAQHVLLKRNRELDDDEDHEQDSRKRVERHGTVSRKPNIDRHPHEQTEPQNEQLKAKIASLKQENTSLKAYIASMDAETSSYRMQVRARFSAYKQEVEKLKARVKAEMEARKEDEARLKGLLRTNSNGNGE